MTEIVKPYKPRRTDKDDLLEEIVDFNNYLICYSHAPNQIHGRKSFRYYLIFRIPLNGNVWFTQAKDIETDELYDIARPANIHRHGAQYKTITQALIALQVHEYKLQQLLNNQIGEK